MVKPIGGSGPRGNHRISLKLDCQKLKKPLSEAPAYCLTPTPYRERLFMSIVICLRHRTNGHCHQVSSMPFTSFRLSATAKPRRNPRPRCFRPAFNQPDMAPVFQRARLWRFPACRSRFPGFLCRLKLLKGAVTSRAYSVVTVPQANLNKLFRIVFALAVFGAALLEF